MSAEWDQVMKLTVEAPGYFSCIEKAVNEFVKEYGGAPWRLKAKAA